jgi:hypothetical protein
MFVPWSGTIVEFTAPLTKSILCMSSSGGGLFGRPATRKSLGRFLIFGRFPLSVADSVLPVFPGANTIPAASRMIND